MTPPSLPYPPTPQPQPSSVSFSPTVEPRGKLARGRGLAFRGITAEISKEVASGGWSGNFGGVKDIKGIKTIVLILDSGAKSSLFHARPSGYINLFIREINSKLLNARPCSQLNAPAGLAHLKIE